jgi:F0F1-type ATP synthase assembly protein I
MKKYLLLLCGVLLLASCSTPKYAYYFDHYDYNSGKKTAKTAVAQNMLTTPATSPLHINQEALVASMGNRIVTVENAPPVTITEADKKAFAEKYSAMSKSEKKEFRKELKSEVKKMIKARKSGESVDSISKTKVMDYDLKMALIFGIVGVVLYALAGVNPVFWILGVVATVVAIVFLIKWIAEQ